MWSDILGDCKKTLFTALGGGGDIVSASLLGLQAERAGFSVGLASIVWERFIYDPVPGPIGLDELRGAEIKKSIAVIDGDSYAVRGGRKIFFQASRASKVLGRKIIALDLKGGYASLYSGIREAIDLFGFDCMVGVDVGGDILASGEEDSLWSPLADSIGLSVLAKAGEHGIVKNTVLAVHSPGSDAELSIERILERTSLISKHNGFLGLSGITYRDVVLLEKLLKEAKTEASMIQYFAFKGEYGEKNIRGNRKISVTPIHMATLFYNPITAYSLSPIAKAVVETRSVFEARKKLNDLGVVTELDLEFLALDYKRETGVMPGYMELVKKREKYRKTLKKKI